MAHCLSQSKDFFDSGVYVRFLRSRSGQKKRCGGHGSLPICRDTGLETNCAVAAVQSGASPWQIYWRHLRRVEVTGRLEAQGASLLSLLALTYRIVCARMTGTEPVNSPGAKAGIPLLRLPCKGEVEDDLFVGGYFFHFEHLHSQNGAKALPL